MPADQAPQPLVRIASILGVTAVIKDYNQLNSKILFEFLKAASGFNSKAVREGWDTRDTK